MVTLFLCPVVYELCPVVYELQFFTFMDCVKGVTCLVCLDCAMLFTSMLHVLEPYHGSTRLLYIFFM